MTLNDLKNSIYRRTHKDATSFPAADLVLALNAANEKVHARIRKYLDNFRPTAWTVADLATGTASPLFDALFHDIISLYISYDRALEDEKPNANGFLYEFQRMEQEIDDWYGARSYEVVTVTIAAPGVFTKKNHGLQAGDKVSLITTGAFPTGLSADVFYFVISTGLSADEFELSTTKDGAAITTTGTQSGTHYFTSDKRKGMTASGDSNR